MFKSLRNIACLFAIAVTLIACGRSGAPVHPPANEPKPANTASNKSTADKPSQQNEKISKEGKPDSSFFLDPLVE